MPFPQTLACGVRTSGSNPLSSFQLNRLAPMKTLTALAALVAIGTLVIATAIEATGLVDLPALVYLITFGAFIVSLTGLTVAGDYRGNVRGYEPAASPPVVPPAGMMGSSGDIIGERPALRPSIQQYDFPAAV